MESKHPEQNLCPTAAIVYYLASKGGIPTTLPDIKNLISDDFLFGEISQMCLNAHPMVPQHVEELPRLYDPLFEDNTFPQEQEFPSNSQDNINCQSQPQVSTNQNNGEHPNKNFFFIQGVQ